MVKKRKHGINWAKQLPDYAKLLIPITHDKRLQSMTDQGYEVLHDPPEDGNFQFSSVAFALRGLHIFKSAETFTA